MQKNKFVNSITQLRNDLLQVYGGLRGGKISGDDAKSFTNVASKVIQSAKTQIEYQTLMKTKKKINFLES